MRETLRREERVADMGYLYWQPNAHVLISLVVTLIPAVVGSYAWQRRGRPEPAALYEVRSAVFQLKDMRCGIAQDNYFARFLPTAPPAISS